MSYYLKKKDGYNIHLYQTDKFKTVQIAVYFRNELKREDIALRALLPSVLFCGSNNYPTKKAITRAFHHLYGGNFNVLNNKMGASNIIGFRASVVNDKYLTGDNKVLETALHIMKDIIFNPAMIDGYFNPKFIEEEVRLIDQQIQSIYNDKSTYSLIQLQKNMFEGERASISSEDLKDMLPSVSKESLTEYYKKQLREDEVNIFLIGDLDMSIFEQIEELFPFEPRTTDYEVVDLEDKEIDEIKEIVELQEINQGNLNIGFRTYIRSNTDDQAALSVMNVILGGYSNSRLFMNVREKHSLCYHVYSSMDAYKGFLYIKLGINPDDYTLAKEVVLEQLKNIQDGDVTQEEMDTAKTVMLDSYSQSLDSQKSMISKMYGDILFDREFDIKRFPEKIKNVTLDDIKRVANKIKLDTIFFLSNKEVS